MSSRCLSLVSELNDQLVQREVTVDQEGGGRNVASGPIFDSIICERIKVQPAVSVACLSAVILPTPPHAVACEGDPLAGCD